MRHMQSRKKLGICILLHCRKTRHSQIYIISDAMPKYSFVPDEKYHNYNLLTNYVVNVVREIDVNRHFQQYFSCQ